MLFKPVSKVKGFASVEVEEIEKAKLIVQADTKDTYPEHAVIIGWPNTKEEQISIAQELAANAKLVHR